MGKQPLGWPNRITIGRICLIAPFIGCLLFQGGMGHGWLRWGPLGIFGLMAISDFLDGYLARRLKQESSLGRVLDPLADKLLITSSVVVLWLLGVRTPEGVAPAQTLHLPAWVVGIALGKDLLVLGGNFVAKLGSIDVRMQARPMGKWCTTAQLLMVLAMLLWPTWPDRAADFVRFLWWAASILAIVAGGDYAVLGVQALKAKSRRSEVV